MHICCIVYGTGDRDRVLDSRHVENTAIGPLLVRALQYWPTSEMKPKQKEMLAFWRPLGKIGQDNLISGDIYTPSLYNSLCARMLTDGMSIKTSGLLR